MLDGTADLTTLNKQAAEEEFVPDEELLEIERKQEAQRIALAHGGFTNLIDFEEAIKNGAGADFHSKNGFPGMMGGSLPKKGVSGEAKAEEKAGEDPIRKILKAQQEAEKSEREKPKMAKTDEAGQVVFTPQAAGHPKTPVAGEATTASEAAAADSATSIVDKSSTPAEEASSAISDTVTEATTSPAVQETAAARHATDEL